MQQEPYGPIVFFPEDAPCPPMPHAHFRFHGLARPEEAVEFEEGSTYEVVLRAREIHPETVLVFCDGRPVPAEAAVRDGSEVRVLRILSGG